MEAYSTRYGIRINTGVSCQNEQRSDNIAEVSDGKEVLYKNKKSYLTRKVWLHKTVYIQQLSRHEMALTALCIVYVSYNILIGTRISFMIRLGDSPDIFSSALPHSTSAATLLRNS